MVCLPSGCLNQEVVVPSIRILIAKCLKQGQLFPHWTKSRRFQGWSGSCTMSSRPVLVLVSAPCPWRDGCFSDITSWHHSHKKEEEVATSAPIYHSRSLSGYKNLFLLVPQQNYTHSYLFFLAAQGLWNLSCMTREAPCSGSSLVPAVDHQESLARPPLS